MLNLETAFRPTAKALRLTSLSLAAIMLAACGGSSESSPPSQTVTSTPVPPPPPPAGQEDITLNTAAKAASFLSKATFGGTQSEIEAAQGKLASEILQNEFAKSPQYILPSLKTAYESGVEIDNRAHASAFWNAMVEGDDQLRQRMVFALSQILVISDNQMGNRPLTNAQYIDTLSKHAFGNYRELLKDVTYTPAMANYLTYMRNRKGNIDSGRMPDENYAREFLQLFTTGLVELNMDGSPKLSGGKSIELFTNEDIVGLARVFTGLSMKGPEFWSADEDGEYSRLVMFQDKHSELEKTFMGKTIAAGTAGDAAIDEAIDHIFEHPNLAPFISRQLIQRFTSSNPTNEWLLLYNAGSNTRLGQQPFQSPSVFNFYRPGYVAPGTQSGAAGLTAPELQIVNEGSVIGYANFMLQFVYNNTSQRDDIIDGFVPDYSNEVALAETPEALAEHALQSQFSWPLHHRLLLWNYRRETWPILIADAFFNLLQQWVLPLARVCSLQWGVPPHLPLIPLAIKLWSVSFSKVASTAWI